MECVRFPRKSKANNDFAAALNLALGVQSLEPLDELRKLYFDAAHAAA